MSPSAAPVGRWIHTWVSAPQTTEPDNMPPAPFTRDDLVLADATLRQTARVTVGGDRLRLRFSNAFGGAALPITAVTVARPVGNRAGVAAIEPGSVRPVTFHGRADVVVPVGAQVVSDPLDFPVEPEANLTVTAFLAEGQASGTITSHPGSRTTSYLLAGDHVEADDLPGATTTDHWYFLSGIEVWSERGGSAVVTLGDSLTDGRGSTTNGNDRWPDRLSARLRAHPATASVAVLNQGTGGNRVLSEGIGPSALARFDRDVLAQSGVRWLVLFEGINDICTADATADVQEQLVHDLRAGYEQIVVRAHAHGIEVFGATLAPLGGNEAYDDPGGHREASRQAVNGWIRGSGVFDAVLDFDAAVRAPDEPSRLVAAYDDGDHLHLTPAGYQALADAVPLELFERP
ncbi:MAG: SGNH/GDSL hydrolase family protein [Saccharothrix sp.]|nr:SGNH/GDSL hydrolase family protein [Saccharothrix sp.]